MTLLMRDGTRDKEDKSTQMMTRDIRIEGPIFFRVEKAATPDKAAYVYAVGVYGEKWDAGNPYHAAAADAATKMGFGSVILLDLDTDPIGQQKIALEAVKTS